MKALILSFFAVILGYSLIFDEKKTTDQPVIKDSNSVYVDRTGQYADVRFHYDI